MTILFDRGLVLAKIETTFDERVLQDMVAWIKSKTGR